MSAATCQRLTRAAVLVCPACAPKARQLGARFSAAPALSVPVPVGRWAGRSPMRVSVRMSLRLPTLLSELLSAFGREGRRVKARTWTGASRRGFLPPSPCPAVASVPTGTAVDEWAAGETCRWRPPYRWGLDQRSSKWRVGLQLLGMASLDLVEAPWPSPCLGGLACGDSLVSQGPLRAPTPLPPPAPVIDNLRPCYGARG
jgi:hypothetical protein